MRRVGTPGPTWIDALAQKLQSKTSEVVHMGLLGEAEVTPETEPFWAGADRGELRMQRCRSCERFYFYPRRTCRYCHSEDVEWRTLSGRARLLSYIINRRPMVPTAAKEPQVIAIVEVDEGPRMLTNIVGVEPDPAALVLDGELAVEFAERGGRPMPVFRPVVGAA
jgi:uncharacterized protein